MSDFQCLFFSTSAVGAASKLLYTSSYKIPTDPSAHGQLAFCPCILLESVCVHGRHLLPPFLPTPTHVLLCKESSSDRVKRRWGQLEGVGMAQMFVRFKKFKTV